MSRDKKIQWLITHGYMTSEDPDSMTNKAIAALTRIPVEEIQRRDQTGFTPGMVMDMTERTQQAKTRYGTGEPVELLYRAATGEIEQDTDPSMEGNDNDRR